MADRPKEATTMKSEEAVRARLMYRRDPRPGSRGETPVRSPERVIVTRRDQQHPAIRDARRSRCHHGSHQKYLAWPSSSRIYFNNTFIWASNACDVLYVITLLMIPHNDLGYD
jgi:hypothetical protein